jgi:hypothetical protein
LPIALEHSPLHVDRTPHCINDTRELDQHSVAGRVDYPPTVFRDLGVDERAVRFEEFVRPLLVRTHQARAAGHIGGEDRGKTADRRHILPGGRLS